LLAVCALRIGADANAVGTLVETLISDPQARAAMTAAAHTLVENGRGALGRTLAAIHSDLPASTEP
jgi:3-deoxy-D-manno-octulosonic-acid transferase